MINNIKNLYLEYVSYGLHHVTEVCTRKYEVSACGKICATFLNIKGEVLDKKRFHIDREEIDLLFNKLLTDYDVIAWMEVQEGENILDGPGAWKLSLVTDGGIHINRNVIRVYPHLIEYIEKDICRLINLDLFDGCEDCDDFEVI